MLKRFFSLLLSVMLLFSCGSALADLPKPIETIPYAQIPENRDDTYHSLPRCGDPGPDHAHLHHP